MSSEQSHNDIEVEITDDSARILEIESFWLLSLQYYEFLRCLVHQEPLALITPFGQFYSYATIATWNEDSRKLKEISRDLCKRQLKFQPTAKWGFSKSDKWGR